MLDATGAVRAMVGGRDHRDSPFNRAVNAHRQPGSAFKPFVYLAAVEAGWRPGNPIDDRPLRIGGWQPANFDGKFRGQITLGEAFAHSVNTSAVRLAQTVGPDRVGGDGAPAGRGSALQPVPSIALGTSEVTLLELTGAYLPFATGGIRRPLFGVAACRRCRPEVLYRHAADRGAGDRGPGGRRPCSGCWRASVTRRHRPRGAAARPPGRRQDRHHPGRPRRLVRRLQRRLHRRRLAGQRRQRADERRARQQPAGADLAQRHAGDAGREARGPAAGPGTAAGKRTGWSG